jgi:hypothetical protein
MASPIKRIVQLVLDRKSAERVEEEVKDSGKRQTDSLKKDFRKLGKVILGVFAIHKLKQFTQEMFNLGAEVVETGSKFVTVFGREAADALDSFIERFRTMAGLTRTQAREFLATSGAIVQGMGASRDAAAGFSERVLRLAGDLQSFNNVPIEQTFAALRSGLTGEAEPLKRFGIILKEADVQARALLDTNKTSADQLNELERAQARLNLIYEKAGVAVGDLERTQDSQANTARRVTTRLRQLREEIAFQLLPIFSIFLGTIDQGTQKLDGIGAAITRVLGWIRDFLGGIQIMAIEFNAFLRSIPARFRGILAQELRQIGIWVHEAEQIINRVRAALGQDAISLGAASILTRSNEMLRTARQDLVAWRILVEEESRKVVEAAHVAGSAVAGMPTAPGQDPEDEGGGGGDPFGVRAAIEEQGMAFPTGPLEDFVGTNETLAGNFESAWADAMQLIRGEMTDTAEMSGQLAVALAQGGTEGVKALAEAKVKENIARAIEEVAKGLGASAMGNAGAASLHFAAAKDHAIAAASWGVVAGGAGAAGGGGARSGSALGSQGRFRDTGGSMSERFQPVGPTTIIYIDPMRANDPVHQEVLHDTLRQAEERFGTVEVRSRRTGQLLGRR